MPVNDQKIAAAVGKILSTVGGAATSPLTTAGPDMVTGTLKTMNTVKNRYNALMDAAKGRKPLPVKTQPAAAVLPDAASQAKLASDTAQLDKIAANVARKVVGRTVDRNFEDVFRALLRKPLAHPLLTAGVLGTAAYVPYAVHRRKEEAEMPTLQQFDMLGSMEQKAAASNAPAADFLKRVRNAIGATARDMSRTKKFLPHLKERMMLLPIEIPVYATSGLLAEKLRRAVLPPLPTTIQIEVQNPNQRGRKYKPLVITSASRVPTEKAVSP